MDHCLINAVMALIHFKCLRENWKCTWMIGHLIHDGNLHQIPGIHSPSWLTSGNGKRGSDFFQVTFVLLLSFFFPQVLARFSGYPKSYSVTWLLSLQSAWCLFIQTRGVQIGSDSFGLLKRNKSNIKGLHFLWSSFFRATSNNRSKFCYKE